MLISLQTVIEAIHAGQYQARRLNVDSIFERKQVVSLYTILFAGIAVLSTIIQAIPKNVFHFFSNSVSCVAVYAQNRR